MSAILNKIKLLRNFGNLVLSIALYVQCSIPQFNSCAISGFNRKKKGSDFVEVYKERVRKND